jgi:hypothetical protein
MLIQGVVHRRYMTRQNGFGDANIFDPAQPK